MTDKSTPPTEPEDDPFDIDGELWHINPDGSGHDKYPPFASFGPGTMPNPDRSRMPDFDPTGEHGPRDLFETTAETQRRYLGGPANAGLPGYVVIGGGTWTASEDGREWIRVEGENESQ